MIKVSTRKIQKAAHGRLFQLTILTLNIINISASIVFSNYILINYFENINVL